jgi:maleylacetate reductase
VDAIALVTTESISRDRWLMSNLRHCLSAPAETTLVVRQHAPVEDVERAVERAAATGANAIISVGGGSAIDTAKITAMRLAERRGLTGDRIPHLAIPTTLSAAELATSAGFTDRHGSKIGLSDPRGLPDVVIYDAELVLATPIQLWLATGIRALDHALEGYLAPGSHPLSDILGMEAAKRLLATLPQASRYPEDLTVRTENQLAAWFSYTLPGPSAAGISHMMGKQIGARYGIPHGVTSCLLLPHVMRYIAGEQPDRMTEMSMAMGLGREPAAVSDAVFDLIHDLDLPQSIAAYGIGEPELRMAADSLERDDVTPADLLDIYMAAL